jgi:hypothetical protein
MKAIDYSLFFRSRFQKEADAGRAVPEAVTIESREKKTKKIGEETKCPSVELNKTFEHTIQNYSFGNLPNEVCKEHWKDGRPFSHFIEAWIAENYPLTHIKGCKKYDFTDKKYPEKLYDEKTFTKRGCKFCPSNMIGQGRSFNKEEFEKKSRKLIFCIVSNIDFPNIKIRFVRGIELIAKYPKGKISSKDFIKFFH